MDLSSIRHIVDSRGLIFLCKYEDMIQSLDVEDCLDGLIKTKRRSLGQLNSENKLWKLLSNTPKRFAFLTYIDSIEERVGDVMLSILESYDDKLLTAGFKSFLSGEILFVKVNIHNQIGYMETSCEVDSVYALYQQETYKNDYITKIYSDKGACIPQVQNRLTADLAKSSRFDSDTSKGTLISYKHSVRKRLDVSWE